VTDSKHDCFVQGEEIEDERLNSSLTSRERCVHEIVCSQKLEGEIG